MYLFRRRILIVDKINHIHFNLLLEIDDIIVNRVYLIPNTCLDIMVIPFNTI